MISSTVEMLDIDQVYGVAVIDEAQMIADSDRGHSWTRGILGIQCPEIHICMSPAAQKVVTHLIELCGDTFEIRSYERKTALVCEEEPFDFPDDVRAGDALIVFTKQMCIRDRSWLRLLMKRAFPSKLRLVQSAAKKMAL